MFIDDWGYKLWFALYVVLVFEVIVVDVSL